MDQDSGRYGKAMFAAGCFWDVEAAFRKADGIIETVTGYTGGPVSNPTYEQVESGTTGHAEVVGIVFDPAVITYEKLLDIFWQIHDPAQEGGQGEYTGSQYRSIIFYLDEGQKAAAIKSRDLLAASQQYRHLPILTEILPATTFWPAEECHQRFYEKCALGHGTSRQIWE